MNKGYHDAQNLVRDPVRPHATKGRDMVPLEADGIESTMDQPLVAEETGESESAPEEEHGNGEQEVIVRRKPLSPSKREREIHEGSHIPFRSWCESCVAGRGRARKHAARHCEPVNRLHFDYFFSAAAMQRRTPFWCAMMS